MRRRRRRIASDHDNHDRWLISYADFITLLFAFFVVMYAISAVNENKYRILASSLGSAFGKAATNDVPVPQLPTVTLPPEVKQVVNVLGGGERLGNYQQVHPWPKTATQNGDEFQMDRIYSRSQLFDKYYVLDQLTAGWAAFYHPDTREVIALSFPVKQVPYLGVWINEGGFAGQYNAALEPCTGVFDRLDVAALHQKVGKIAAHSEYCWHLNLIIQKIADPRLLEKMQVSEDGQIFLSSGD